MNLGDSYAICSGRSVVMPAAARRRRSTLATKNFIPCFK